MDIPRLLQNLVHGLATIVVLAVGIPLLVTVSPFLFCLGNGRPQRNETTNEALRLRQGARQRH